MADHSKPTLASQYPDVLSELDARLKDQAAAFDPAKVTAENIPADAVRWSSGSRKWEYWTGAAWVDLAGEYAINISGTASKLKTARSFQISGAATAAPVNFDGSGNVNLNVTAVDGASVSSATTIKKGAIALADNQETDAGTNAEKAVTPAGLSSVLGTAARADVTTSPDDTTPGRVLRVGDFGLGASGAALGSAAFADLTPDATDATPGRIRPIGQTGWDHPGLGSDSVRNILAAVDDYPYSGLLPVIFGSGNPGLPQASYFYMMQFRYQAGNCTIMLLPYLADSGGVWVKSRYNGTWSAWMRLDGAAWADITGIPAYASRWPTWGEVSGKPTTFAPAVQAYQQIGSYVAGFSGVVVAPGGSVTGANLRPCNFDNTSQSSPALSGTWRCMGYTTAANQATLFQRIA